MMREKAREHYKKRRDKSGVKKDGRMQMKNNNKGSVSIYIILIFAVLLSFILLIVEGARKNAIRLKTECAMDLSMSSALGEYNRELLEQYELFFIDTSYGKKQASIDHTAEHIKGYLTDNFEASDQVSKDLLGLVAEQVLITDYSLASDENGALLKKQAVDYMKDLYGVSYAKEFKKQLDEVNEKGLFTLDVSAIQGASQSKIDSYPLPKKKVTDKDGDHWEDVRLDNPADAVNATRGIISLVLPAETEISTAAINPSNYLSGRNCNTGSGLAGRTALKSTDETVFNEYILKKSGNYAFPKDNSELKYEMEYILHGKSSDIDNLKATITQLLFLREASNYIFLCASPQRCSEAELLADSVSLAAFSPELKEPIKQTILCAWAYAESVYDVRKLLEGGKIPLMKDDESWHYSLDSMFGYATDAMEEDLSAGAGMDYTDYLRLYLMLKDSEIKTKRFMNVVEMDVRRTTGNSYFRLDCCVDSIEAEALVSSTYGANYTISRSIAYSE